MSLFASTEISNETFLDILFSYVDKKMDYFFTSQLIKMFFCGSAQKID